MKETGRLLTTILLCAACCFAGGESLDTLAGVLPALLREGVYLVESDVEAPIDQTVTIEPGVTLLFRDFTGLHVQGKLVALGTPQKPIVFTSEFDGRYHPDGGSVPNPYDWNGIYIHKGAVGTSMAHCIVMYSVYGIKSDTKFIRIESGGFAHNGKADLEIEGERHETSSGPVEYILDVTDATVDGVPVTLLRDPLAPKRNGFRYSALTIAVGALAGGAYCGIQAKTAADEIKRLQRKESFLVESSTQFEYAENEYIKNAAFAGGCGAAALLGVFVFVWTFTF